MRRKLWLLGFFKIPLLHYCKPKLISLTDEEMIVKIALRRRTKNHLNSMYFGALAVGADITSGLFAFYYSTKNKQKMSFAFKSANMQFLKRAESDVIFKCRQGLLIKECIDQSASEKKRINKNIDVEAFNKENELVASFQMTLSVKVL
ncbi:MAG: DUF4442 domain-containing protein [Flavobacteriaceae bacterium]|nr:DUF4442 domain-containing protein [Flavobacteriaceae bacterium]